MKFKKVVVMSMILSLLSFSAPRRSEAVLLAALGVVTGGGAIACYAIAGVFIYIGAGLSIGYGEQVSSASSFLVGLALGKDGKANGFASPKAEDLVNEGYGSASAEKISSELHELSARLEKEQKPFHLSGKSSAEIVQNLMNETGLSKESAEYLVSKIAGAQSAELEQESVANSSVEQGKQNQAVGQSGGSVEHAQIAVSNAK